MTSSIEWNDDNTALTLTRQDAASGDSESITADAHWWLDAAIQVISSLPGAVSAEEPDEPLSAHGTDPERMGRVIAAKIRNLTGQLQ